MDTSISTAAAPAPVNIAPARPAPASVDVAENPTATRYGWCMFGDIALVGGDGSINLYVQSAQLQVGDNVVPNPYHRLLPAKQLIPFPSFNYLTQLPSQDRRDSQGRALLDTTTSLMSALDAIVLVMQRYGMWGFTMLRSLEGIEDQARAFRIFQVVQPLAYSMKDMIDELSFGYELRRDQTEPFEMAPGYKVAPLRDDDERTIADRLAKEMLSGAEVALGLADQTLDDTETSIVRRLSGGGGKTGPDPLDRRLMLETGRTLPTVQTVHGGGVDLSGIKKGVDTLIDHARMQALKDENEELRKQVGQKTSPKAAPAEVEATTEVSTAPTSGSAPAETTKPTEKTICGHIKANNEPCRTPTNGGKCAAHRDKE